MNKIVDYNEICNKLFVDYEGIINRFLLIRLKSKIFDIAMCIVNDSYIGEKLRKKEKKSLTCSNVKLLFLLFYMLLLLVVICNKIVENISYNFVEFDLYDFTNTVKLHSKSELFFHTQFGN